MRKRLRTGIICLCLHCVASGTLYGCLQVYQRGYNTMHREQIALANVTVTDQQARVQILEENWEMPLGWLSEDSMFYYAAYALTGENLHFWLYLIM